MRTRTGSLERRLVLGAVVAGLLVHGLQLGAYAAVRAAVDRREQVSELRLDAAMETFRPVDRSGLAQPADVATFAADRNPRTEPTRCRALTALTTTAPLDGRSWTGVNGRPAQPVTLLTVRFADAGAARAELDRKRWALLRCTRVVVTFPPYDAPPTSYEVGGRRVSSAVGDTVRWSLVDDGRRFDFYVRRYGNTLSWTYADDVSTPAVREQVADSLVDRLKDLAGR
ncbi:hypothetical protein SAMN04488544_2557 [Microlunatus sagamiharensis]|uniref:PknH-like extracellular domain-containing protein n=1 Tax=Microlunatus sagamiharensis TaxID=546874 RepID=A0A1H2MR13_9ACTN|nr:hypothetical protein [Microlunatus sagamiharensis]SDU95687.1 hypothetical protein SAMN04488544_2557 [Microlunatus sagamiharensis]